MLITAVFIVASCTATMGSIGDFKYDKFWVVPKRMTYSLNTSDRFKPQEDLSAFASYMGMTDSIPIEKVEIRITETPDGTPVEWSSPISSNDSYSFGNSGKKLIKINYGSHSYEYSVMVLSSSSGNGNGNGNGGEDPDPVNPGNGIEIIW
jgi:hypothetical protein